MKLLLALLFLAAALAQPIPPSAIVQQTGVPAGTCSGLPDRQITASGALYVCAGGTWTLLATPGGATIGGSAGQFEYNNAGAFGGTTGMVWVAPTGTADQTVISTAISALPAGGGTIVLAAGTYAFSGTLQVLKSNVTLRGVGLATIIQLGNAVNTDVIDLGNNTTPVSQVTIADMLIDGAMANNTTAGINGIYVWKCAKCSVDHVTVQNTVGENIFVDGSTTEDDNFTLTNSKLLNTKAGSGKANLRIRISDYATVVGNSISGGATWGALLDTNSDYGVFAYNIVGAPTANNTVEVQGTNWVVLGNTITATTRGIDSEADYTYMFGNNISVPASGLDGIDLNGLYSVAEANLVTSVSTTNSAIGILVGSNSIAKNNVVNVTSSAGDEFVGIRVNAAASASGNLLVFAGSRTFSGVYCGPGCTVTDNVINFIGASGSSNTGVFIGTTHNGVTVTGNYIYNPDIGVWLSGGAQAGRSVIASNVIQLANVCIELDSAVVAQSITGNTCEGNGANGREGILLTGNAIRDSVISGNSIYNFAKEGIKGVAVQRSVIANNAIRNVGRATNNTYAAILLSTSTGASTTNVVSGNEISSDAANKPSYGIRENTSSDGPNWFVGNIVANTVTADISIQNTTSVVQGLAPVAFAALPTMPNGTQIYCSDCQVTTVAANVVSDATCTSGGSGAFAMRINGAWKCTYTP